MKVLWPVVAIVILSLVLASCAEEEPSEIGFRTTLNGVSTGCTAMVFNNAGMQLQEVPSELGGFGFIKDVKPGTYTLKFKDVRGNMFPAVRSVTIGSGDSVTVDVELSQETEGGAPAPAAGE